MEEGLNSKEADRVQATLNKIVQEDTELPPLTEDLVKSLNRVLQEHPILAEDACKAIAYLGRQVEFRDLAAATNDGILVKSVVPLLSHSNDDIVLQSLRAIGNLCHDEDTCRQHFLKYGGCPLLKDVVLKCSTKTESLKLKAITCGCLLNVCCDNETLCKELLGLSVLTPLCEGILSNCSDEMVLTMGVKALTVLTDSCSLSELSSSSVPVVLSGILKTCVSNEYNAVIELVLELIETNSASKDNAAANKWNVSIVERGCFEVLLTLPSEYISKVLDIISLILSSDEALNLVFTDQKLRDFVYCLIKGGQSVDVKIKAAATLVLGNMARTDKYSETLVTDGTLDIVAENLLSQPISEENSKLYYAAMSLLRNLSIPEANKLIMLQNSIVSKVIEVLNKASDPTVLMKTLGCLRLLSSRKEICKIVCPCVGRICEVCENASFDHIKIEGGRLISALVKNSSDNDDVAKLAEGSGIKWLVYLLQNEHMVVKNDGILALILLGTLKNDLFYKSVLSNELGLVNCLTDVMATATPEVFENSLTLLILLRTNAKGYIEDETDTIITTKVKGFLDKLELSDSSRKKIQQLLGDV